MLNVDHVILNNNSNTDISLFNKNMKRLTVLMLVLMASGCANDTVDDPTVYVFDRFETGTVRIFAEGTPVENAALSERYVNEWTGIFYPLDQFKLDSLKAKTLTFTSDHRLLVDGTDSGMKMKITRDGDKVYFEATDTIYSYRDLINIPDGRFVFAPRTQTDVVLAPGQGFPPLPQAYYGYLSCSYAIEDDEELRIPFMNMLEKNCDSDGSGLISGCVSVNAFANTNNMFNSNYAKTHQSNYTDRDTLVVQENFVVFRRTR